MRRGAAAGIRWQARWLQIGLPANSLHAVLFVRNETVINPLQVEQS